MKRKNDDKTKTAKGRNLLLISLFFILLFLLLIILLSSLLNRKPGTKPVEKEGSVAVSTDSQAAPPLDTFITGKDAEKPCSATVIKPPKPRPKKPIDTTVKTDTVKAEDAPDSVSGSTESLPDSASAVKAGCSGDTSQLWVYPDPAGGIHAAEVQVRFVSNRPAIIHFRLREETEWRQYDGSPIIISSTTNLYFDAIDTCGNVMERKEEYYEIDTSRKQSPCPNDMEEVKVGEMNFCIDRYEWPNRRGVRPRTLVSLYQAMDSCYSAGKRLCTAEEWMIACAGPYTWKYPYGQRYEPYRCVTHDTTVLPSGGRSQCRSFFGLFDMSGNLLEWTSTRASENSAFYYVLGGFWESGPKSGCRDKRYSYYPQNSHNPVGFRCCRDLVPSSDGKKKGVDGK